MRFTEYASHLHKKVVVGARVIIVQDRYFVTVDPEERREFCESGCVACCSRIVFDPAKMQGKRVCVRLPIAALNTSTSSSFETLMTATNEEV